MNIAPQAYPYQDRMDRIVDYIYAHLDSEIDLDQLAEIACLSRFHWHRTYKALSGENAGGDRQTVAFAPGGDAIGAKQNADG